MVRNIRFEIDENLYVAIKVKIAIKRMTIKQYITELIVNDLKTTTEKK